VLDNYIHFNIVYYKHNGDDEPYDVQRITTEQVDASGFCNVAIEKMCAHAFDEERISSPACYVTRITTVTYF